MSKFYVGGTFSRYEEVRATIDQITELGHECAHDWTRGEWFSTDTAAGDGYTAMDHWPEMARAEVEAVREVARHFGFCVFLGEQASIGWTAEFGMAIAFDVAEIIVVKPFKTTVFMALPNVVQVETIDDALVQLSSK